MTKLVTKKAPSAARGAAPLRASLPGLGCFITAPIGVDQGAADVFFSVYLKGVV